METTPPTDITTKYPQDEINYTTTETNLSDDLLLLRHISNSSDSVSDGTASSAIFYAVMSAVFLLGVVGNSLLVLVFFRHKVMRTAPNTYIFSLALADLGTLLMCACAPLLDRYAGTLPALCKAGQAALETSMGTIAFTLLALSMERYWATARPFRRSVSPRRLSVCVACAVSIWLFSISFTVAKILLLPRNNSEHCVLMFNPNSLSSSYSLADLFLFYVVPLAGIAVFYVLLAKELYTSNKLIKRVSDPEIPVPRHVKDRRKLAVIVLAMVILYAVAYFPYNFLSLRLYLDLNFVDSWDSPMNILFCIGCIHTSFNPVILYMLSESFREHFNYYLLCGQTKISVTNKQTTFNKYTVSSRRTSNTSYLTSKELQNIKIEHIPR